MYVSVSGIADGAYPVLQAIALITSFAETATVDGFAAAVPGDATPHVGMEVPSVVIWMVALVVALEMVGE